MLAGKTTGARMPGSSLPQGHRSRSLVQRIWDERTARVLSTALLFCLALVFLYAARDTLTLFLFSILFAYFLAPMVGRLQRPLRGRGKAILVVYFVLFAGLTGLGFLFGPHIAEDGRSLLRSLPELVNRFASGQMIYEFGEHHHWTAGRDAQLQQFIVEHRAQILAYVEGLVGDVAEPMKHIWWIFLIPILSVFFLKQGEEIAEGIAAATTTRRRHTLISSFLEDVNVMLGSYIRAQMILAAMTMVSYLVVLSLMQVPYPFVLGPVSGFLEFIPVVGPAIAAASVVILAGLAGYNHILWLIFFLGCWRLQQDYLSAPRIMGSSVKINPLMQIFAVLAGGEIGGFVGALVSVPTVAMLRILWHLLRRDSAQVIKEAQADEEASGSQSVKESPAHG